MKIIAVPRFVFFVLSLSGLLYIPVLYAPGYGSDSAVARQSAIVFASVDTDNAMTGFSVFENGFSLEDAKTTCTFNSLFPVSGTVNLAGGSLTLSKNLIFDQNVSFVNSGRIEGNSCDVVFNTVRDLNLPCYSAFSVVPITSQAMTTAVQSVDWSYDGRYIASGALKATSGVNCLQLYYFDGTTLTATAGADMTKHIYSVRWHPTQNYLAVGRQTGAAVGNASGYEVIIYSYGSGPLKVRSGADLGSGTGYATVWHPSGNYLIVGSDATANELIVYSFNTTTAALAQSSVVNLSPDRTVQIDALSFCPGGNYMAAGVANNATGGANELLLYTFSTSLTSTNGVDVGYDVRTLDWSPTGTYIAVGLAGSTQNLRVYQHKAWNGTIAEATAARIGETKSVLSVHWDKTGNYLLVGKATGVHSEICVYYFDKNTLTLTRLLGNNASMFGVNSVCWSRDSGYIAYGEDASSYKTYVSRVLRQLPLVLQDANLYFKTNVTLTTTLYVKGTCKINTKGRQFNIVPAASVLIRPGGQLIFEDVDLRGLAGSKIRCMNNAGSLVLRKSGVELSGAYTFSQGSILFDQEVLITGTNILHYCSPLTSTIARKSSLYLSTGFTFSYAPVNSKTDLLYFDGTRSVLYCDGATLYAKSTGIQFKKGTMMIDKTTTFATETIASPSPGSTGVFIIGNNSSADDITCKVLSGAILQVASGGSLVYQNIGSQSWNMYSASSVVCINSAAALKLDQTLDAGVGLVQFKPGASLIRATNMSLLGSVGYIS